MRLFQPTVLLFFLFGIVPLCAESQVVINEVCSYNGNVIEDEDDDQSDWFELYNKDVGPISVAGYSVTDGSGDRWYFPSVSIPGNGYLLVFASGKDRTAGELHTSFKLSRSGDQLQLYDTSDALISEAVVPTLQMDHSLGCYPDGAYACDKLFYQPSPGASNDMSIVYTAYVADVVFSHGPGFYSSPLDLTLSCATPGAQIFFTLNGSEPTLTSETFQTPLHLDTSVVVRARAYASGGMLPSRTETNTYMFNLPTSLPVFSITTDPENLWDWNAGIYVLGPNADSVYPYWGANFWQDWEVPAHVEFFEVSHDQVLEQDVGLSINGGSVSRTRPQQSFRLSCRQKYGFSSFEHRFFSERTNDDFKILVLRNSSGDWNKTHFRDGSLHKLMLNETDNDLLAYRPAVVILNGQFWGILNIREKVSKHYLAENYDVDKDNIDILEEDSTVIQGDFTAFLSMYYFITQHDMSDPANYDSAVRMVDIENFCDYFICETFFSNIDWPYNNMKYWRERKVGAKWRYILLDLDISLGNNGWAPASLDLLGKILSPYGDDNRHVKIFRGLLRNGDFRNYFINRYADLVNTLFTSENLNDHIEGVMETIDDEVQRHFWKWGNTMEGWHYEIDNAVTPYIEARPAYALQFIQDNFFLEGQTDVNLNVWPAAAGSIRINTVTPDRYPWSGIYFDSVPIQLTAVPQAGFKFHMWSSDNEALECKSAATITFVPETAAFYTAYFLPEGGLDEIYVYPNPTCDHLNACFVNSEPGEALIRLMDMQGRVMLELEQRCLPGPNSLALDMQAFTAGSYLLEVRVDGLPKVARVQIIR